MSRERRAGVSRERRTGVRRGGREGVRLGGREGVGLGGDPGEGEPEGAQVRKRQRVQSPMHGRYYRAPTDNDPCR